MMFETILVLILIVMANYFFVSILLYFQPYCLMKDTRRRKSNLSTTTLCILDNLLNGSQYDRLSHEEEKPRKFVNCQRFIFRPSQEESFEDPELLHYFIASKLFYQNLMMVKNQDLPRKILKDPWDSLECVVYIRNLELEFQFEAMKSKFKGEGKLNAFGDVAETLLFHGTSNESLNQIVENNFTLDHLPSERGKMMLFGRGFYFSQVR